MEEAEKTLSERELAGCNTSWARDRHAEAEWRIGCTSDHAEASLAVERLKTALECANPPDGLTQDCGGSFAPGTDVWFLKLDRSTDQLLAREWPWRAKPTFLEQIDDPVRMLTYLQDLCWSDVRRCGRDNRKELNLAISVIARLILQGGQAGYLAGPGFQPVFERFVRDWQDPQTGFFGMTYIVDDEGSEVRTTDLSLTFHMARYVPLLVRWWPTLIDTLLGISEQQYPQGWTKDGRMSDHNNYDVVELFYRGWKHMSPGQRRLASRAVATMFEWCLAHSVGQNGEIIEPDKGDMIPDSVLLRRSLSRHNRFFRPRQTVLDRPDAARPGADQKRYGRPAEPLQRRFDRRRRHARAAPRRSAAMVERDFLERDPVKLKRIRHW